MSEQKKLKKPYEYELSREKTLEMFKRINDLFKTKMDSGYQCALPDRKMTLYGMRLRLFLLAFHPGFIEGKGVTKEEWESCCKSLQDILVEYLGDGAKPYCEPYNENRKFQARYETYILFE